MTPFGPAITWIGCDRFERVDQGWAPRRFPSHWTDRLPPVSEVRFRASSGLHAVVDTDAAELRFTCRMGRLDTFVLPAPDDGPDSPVLDVAIDGDLPVSFRPERLGTVDGVVRATWRIALPMRDALPGRAGLRTVEVWPPHDGDLTIEALTFGPAPVSERRTAPQRPRWAHHGSSISHGGEAASPTRTWPVLAARGLGLELVNFAVPGECHLDAFVAETMASSAPDAVSLEVGTNVVGAASMTDRTFVVALHQFLDRLRDRLPDVPITVISPIVLPVLETRAGPLRAARADAAGVGPGQETRQELWQGALDLPRARRIVEDVVEQRSAVGDRALRVVDGLGLLGHDDHARLGDGIHPDTDGHRLIAERFVELASSQ